MKIAKVYSNRELILVATEIERQAVQKRMRPQNKRAVLQFMWVAIPVFRTFGSYGHLYAWLPRVHRVEMRHFG